MEVNWPIQVNIPPPQHAQPRQTHEMPAHSDQIQNASLRNLSVSEVLQFTPLTTSVLPAHDRIPLPQVSRAKESSKLTSSAEKKAIQQVLGEYPVTKIKDRLQSFLKAELLPEFKFKKWPTIQEETQQDSQNAKQPDLNLSPTAQMILDATSVDYRCGSQRHVERQTRPSSQVDRYQQSSGPVTTKPIQNAPIRNDRVLSRSEGQLPSTTKSFSRQISVNIPKPVSILNQSTETQTIQPKAPIDHPPHKAEPVVQLSLHVRSQREAAEAALQQFQNTLLEVFEAQDLMDAGAGATGFFEDLEEGENSEPSLSFKAMESLLNGLKKLVALNKLSDLSSEHLRRLQMLCENSIDQVQTIDLRLPSRSDHDEQQRWRRNMRKADNGLLSASVLLHTTLDPSIDDSLLTTEALMWIPSALGNVFENCLIPAVEARPDESSTDTFKTISSVKDSIKKLLESGRKVLDFASTACTKTRGLESMVNPIEFLAAKLIFVQNATTDKTSALGIQTFEKTRKAAMASLGRIFARFPAERKAILDEILASLDKLPSNSRSARQYRLGNGSSIQLISALFMQLVQNTALETPRSQSKSKKAATKDNLEDLTGIAGNEDDEEADEMQGLDEQADVVHDDALTRLQNTSKRLFDVAARSAHDIVSYLITRASNTTKTGDLPYRNVLELFVEDLLNVLSSPEWPSSELMLRIMEARMTEMATHEKTASAKNMALECLGTMGSAISMLKTSLSRQCASLSRDGRPKSAVAQHLSKLASEQDHRGIQKEDLVAFNGPFAIVSRYLWTEARQGLRNLSACGFFLAQYAKYMSIGADIENFDEGDIEAESVRVVNFILDSIAQIGSGSTEAQNFDAVLAEEAELAYTLVVLNMGFCRRFGLIVKTLSSSFTSDQAQVRSRSLKSVVTILETDSTLLERDESIADDVFKCASDDSAMVRDSALSLIARFIIVRPALERKGIQRLLECASDAKVGVQKRAIGHLRDIYVKDDRQHLKSTISQIILRRTADHEETVADLAKKTLTEIWVTPTLNQLVHSADLVKTTVAIEGLASDIVNCIAYDTALLCPLFRKFLKTILTSDSKSIGKIRDLCGRIVEALFENIISNQDDRGSLMVLTSFAEADPLLIPPSNLGKLQPYLGNLKSENDLFVFKAVITIFGCVLPHLSATHKPLLHDTQNALMKAISSLGRRTELDTVMSCLQVIDSVLQNTMRLIKLAGSIMLKIRSGASALAKSQDGIPQLLKLLRIAGALGRHIDLEKHWQQFAQEVKDMQGRSVSGYMADVILPLTQPGQPSKVRLMALESLGSLCQAFPALFNLKRTRETFFSVFASGTQTGDSADTDSLQGIVLRVFDELYGQRAKSKEGDSDAEDDNQKQDLGKLGGDSKTRDGDSAISMITGSVAKNALAVALSSPGENALVATRTLASISHQGLNHPKHSLLAFVALSTCPDNRIAKVAHEAHRILHQQHESVCEREYMTAIQEAFEYQRKVLNDPHGARQPTYQAKLASCFEIVNTSGTKYVKKFLSGLVSRISARISTDGGVVHIDQVLWTLFAVQNLAFFEFAKVDEVLHTILQLELAYSKKGVEISQLLEAALYIQPKLELQDAVNLVDEDQMALEAAESSPTRDLETIRRLSPLAATLTIMMEGRSYLKRQYGVGRDVRAAISNNKQAKDGNKAPTKVHGITGERFWTGSNAAVGMLENDDKMIACCQNFITLMSMDDEVMVDEEDYFGEPAEGNTRTDSREQVRGTTPGGVKRKLSASASSTPVKRMPGRPRKETRRSASMSSADEFDAEFTN